MRSKKGKTAVYRCDPALSVLVVLVSRNDFHVASALQSNVCSNKAAFSNFSAVVWTGRLRKIARKMREIRCAFS